MISWSSLRYSKHRNENARSCSSSKTKSLSKSSRELNFRSLRNRSKIPIVCELIHDLGKFEQADEGERGGGVVDAVDVGQRAAPEGTACKRNQNRDQLHNHQSLNYRQKTAFSSAFFKHLRTITGPAARRLIVLRVYSFSEQVGKCVRSLSRY